MCEEEWFDESQNDEEDEELYEDIFVDAIPRKKRYHQADAPTPIEERLQAYKYYAKTQRCVQHLQRLVRPYMEDGEEKKPNLFVRVVDSAFTFTPVSAEYKVNTTPIESFGHALHYVSSTPTLSLTTTLHCKHAHHLPRKYKELYTLVFNSDGMTPVYIAGLPFFIEGIQAPFDGEIQVTFVALIGSTYGNHTTLRQREQKIKQNFGKFANA